LISERKASQRNSATQKSGMRVYSDAI